MSILPYTISILDRPAVVPDRRTQVMTIEERLDALEATATDHTAKLGILNNFRNKAIPIIKKLRKIANALVRANQLPDGTEQQAEGDPPPVHPDDIGLNTIDNPDDID